VAEITLFPFAQYWWFYLAFLAGVMVLLALDLGVFHREAHEVRFREAATWSIVWVSLALAFNYGLYHFALWKFPQDPRLLAIPGFDAAAAAKETALEFLTGFVVEKSLSVDNLFVFLLLLGAFAVPRELQQRVLLIGVAGALVLRGVFIALGAQLIASFSWGRAVPRVGTPTGTSLTLLTAAVAAEVTVSLTGTAARSV